MSEEEIETLIAQAATDALDAGGKRRWEALCREQPQLQDDADALREVTAELRETVQRAEARARAQAPAAPPPYVLAQLETARRQVFQSGARDGLRSVGAFARMRGRWGRLRAWLSEGFRMPVALAGAAAVVALLVLGPRLVERRQNNPTMAVVPILFKEAVSSPDLPLAAPSAQTALTDPTVLWISLSRDPVELTLLDGMGRELRRAQVSRTPVEWVAWGEPSQALTPGQTYLLRLKQGQETTERVVAVAADAKPLAEWAARPDAAVLARSWLEAGRAGDTLALIGALSAVKDADDLADLRSQALKAALQSSAPAGAAREK